MLSKEAPLSVTLDVPSVKPNDVSALPPTVTASLLKISTVPAADWFVTPSANLKV